MMSYVTSHIAKPTLRNAIILSYALVAVGVLTYMTTRAVKAACEIPQHHALSTTPMAATKILEWQRRQPDGGTETVALHKFKFRTGDVVLFTYNSAIRFLTDSPYSHVGLVVDSGTMLFHTTPHPPYVPRCEPVFKALSRTMAAKRTFRRCRVVVRRITMPKDVRRRARTTLGKFVRERHNHKHAYNGVTLLKELFNEFVGDPQSSGNEKYCSGLIASALKHAGILKRWWCAAVLPCHFDVPYEHHVLEFASGCALWPPVSLVSEQ